MVTSFPTQFHHHHHVVPLAQIFLTLSHHFSLSFISSGRSSGLHSVYSHSCCMYVLAGRTALARPYVGVHRSTSLMSLIPAPPEMSCVPGSSNLDSFRDGRQMVVYLVLCGVLPPGLVTGKNAWYSAISVWKVVPGKVIISVFAKLDIHVFTDDKFVSEFFKERKIARLRRWC